MNIFQITLRVFVLFWLLTLEKVMGLPVAFLALSWRWVDRIPPEEGVKQWLILVLLGWALAVVYQIPFVLGLLFIWLGWLGRRSVKTTSSLFQWREILFSLVISASIFIFKGYQANLWLFLQMILSVVLVYFVQKISSK